MERTVTGGGMRRSVTSRRTALLTLGGASLAVLSGCAAPIRGLTGFLTPRFPAWAYTMPRGGEAYAAAFDHPDLMATLLCYCGCLSFEQPHDSLRECFMDRAGEINTHAAFCETCQGEAIDAVAWHKQGMPWAEIRQRIDQTYASRAPEFGGSGCGGASTDHEAGEGAACGP